MPRMTIAQLTDENIRLRAQLDLVERERDAFKRDLEIANDTIAGLQAPRTEPRARTPERALPAHMAAARELAMRFGRSVRVG